VRWENKVHFHCLLSCQPFCQKLLQSNAVCKDYSKSKVGRFFETQCTFCSCGFFFLLFSSPILSGRRLDVYHTFTHDVGGLNANLECRSEMCCRTAQKKLRKKSPSAHHCTTLSGYIFASKAYIDNRKKLLNSNISSTSFHNMVNFGPLSAEIGLPVWGTPANFNGFRFMASLLQRRRSVEVNQTFRDVWPSPGLVHYIYMFGGYCPPNGFLPGA